MVFKRTLTWISMVESEYSANLGLFHSLYNLLYLFLNNVNNVFKISQPFGHKMQYYTYSELKFIIIELSMLA